MLRKRDLPVTKLRPSCPVLHSRACARDRTRCPRASARSGLQLIGFVLATALTFAAGATRAAAQIISIDSVEANVPALGVVVSPAAGGDSLFRISASDGSVIRVSGNAVRLGTGTTRALVTVTCTGTAELCSTARETVSVSAAGTPTGRATALTNFTVAAGPNPPSLGPVTQTASTTTFEVSGIPAGATRNFYLGADMGIRDDSGGSTGSASSGFSVSVPANTVSGQAIATVIRPINLAKNSDLAFGAVVRPSLESSTVSISPNDGSRTISGGNGVLVGTAASRATYSVTGEGGQVFSISIPSTFTMIGPETLSVTTSSSASGTGVLSGALGSAGSFSFGIGGSTTVTSATPAGTYSGTFNVTVQYN